jgi:hypothetical protein
MKMVACDLRFVLLATVPRPVTRPLRLARLVWFQQPSQPQLRATGRQLRSRTAPVKLLRNEVVSYCVFVVLAKDDALYNMKFVLEMEKYLCVYNYKLTFPDTEK